MKRNTGLVREQLDAKLRRFRPLRDTSPPVRGWIRAIRDALGMNGRQLADRLGDHRSRAQALEKQELAGSVTLKTMRRVAEALDCVFVYGIVPRTSLEDTVAERARQVAIKRLARASHSMTLEGQGLRAKENDKVLAEMIDDMVATTPSILWDKLDDV